MNSEWIGCSVSVDCGKELGIFQGQISDVNRSKQTISLRKPYRNGIYCTVPEITICAQDIYDLKILDLSSCDSSKNVDKDSGLSSQEVHLTDKRRTQTTSEIRRKPTTPKKIDIRRKWQERDEACFSAPVDSFILENEFDFEKNLALFDKEAVFQKIEADTKPDLLNYGSPKLLKYRCDENVIEQDPVVYRQIIVPMADKIEYVTDAGLIVPSVQLSLRNSILATAEKRGLTLSRQADMIGRAASEMVVQLLGGSHRLNPENTHQKPVVVIFCGAHFQGQQGISCGRHLANHGAHVLLYLPDNLKMTPHVAAELNLFKLTDGKHITNIKDLPRYVIDIVISALDDHSPVSKEQLWLRAAADWANQCRAPALALDPPPEGSSITFKWSIFPALPPSFEGPGAVYLCDLGIPQKVFSEVGIRYSSPFGAKFLVPLHKKSR